MARSTNANEEITQVSPPPTPRPANDIHGEAWRRAYDAFARQSELARAANVRAHLLRSLILSTPECEWPSKRGWR